MTMTQHLPLVQPTTPSVEVFVFGFGVIKIGVPESVVKWVSRPLLGERFPLVKPWSPNRGARTVAHGSTAQP